jgi:hypothetical protein
MFNRRGDKVYGQQIPGDKIRVGNISGGTVAIGRNAQAGDMSELLERRAVLIGRIAQMDLAQLVTLEGLLAAAGL